MASNRSDVNLIITAKNEASKTIAELEKSIKSLGQTADGKPFDKLTASSDSLRKKQAELSAALTQVKEKSVAVAKGIKSGNSDILSQKNVIDKLRESLEKLNTKYATAGKQQLPARPSDSNLGSLEKQIAKRDELSETIKNLRVELQKTEKALSANGGIDTKAQTNIEKYNDKVKQLGKAWRDASSAVGEAKRSLKGVTSRKAQIEGEVKAQQQKVKLLREEAKLAYQTARKPARDFDADSKGDQRAAKQAAEQNHQSLMKQRDEAVAKLKEYKSQLSEVSKEETAAAKVADSATAKIKLRSQAYEQAKASAESFVKSQQASGSQRQNDAIDKTRASLVRLENQLLETEASYKRTQAALSKSVSPSTKSITDFQNLKIQIKETEDAIKGEVANLAKLEKEFDSAGISAAQLAQQQERLDRISDKLTKEQQELATQLNRTAAAEKKAAVEAKNFNESLRGDGSRKSLSFLQRLRGEILAIAATYTGLYAVGGGISSIYDASVLTQKATSRLSAKLNGDMESVQREISFVTAEAERLGLEFEVLLDQYSKFAVNVPNGSLSLEQIRFTFSGIAEAARVVGLSTDDVNATFRALSQIASKGSVQLEELKGQLGERIPKAIELTAKGLSDMSGELITTEELLKRINDGDVTSDTVVALAKSLKEEFGQDLTKALESPQVPLNEFKNELFNLKKDLIDSGFMDELVNGLKEITKTMRTPEFRDGAKALASGFIALVNVLIELVKNFDKIAVLVGAIVGSKILAGFASFTKTVTKLSGTMGALGVNALKSKKGVLTLASAFRVLSASLGPIAIAATAGFLAGEFLNQFDIVRIGVLKLQAAIFTFVEITKGWFLALGAVLGGVFTLSFSDIKGDLAEIGEATAKELLKIESITEQMLDDIENKGKKKKIKVLDPKDARTEAQIYSDEISKGLKFFTSESNFESLKTGLDNVLDELGEESANTLDKRLKLIENEYSEFLKEISEFDLGSKKQIEEISRVAEEKIAALQTKIDKTDNGNFRLRLEKQIGEIQKRQAQEVNKLIEQRAELGSAASKTNELIELRKRAETQEVFDEQTTDAQTKINDLISERGDKLDKVNSLAELNLITSERQGQQINAINDEYLAKIKLAVEESKKLGESNGNQDLVDFTKTLDGYATIARVKADIEEKDRQQAEFEKDINDVLSERASIIDLASQKAELGLIPIEEQSRVLRETNNEYLVKINEILAKARELAATTGNIGLQQSLTEFDAFGDIEKRKSDLDQLALKEQQINDAISIRDAKVEKVNNQIATGQITRFNGEVQIRDILNQENLLIREMVLGARDYAEAINAPEQAAQFEASAAGMVNLKDEILNADDTAGQFASGLTNAIDNFIFSTQSAKEAFKQFIGSFLRQIGTAIIQALILRAIMASLGAVGGGEAAAGAAPVGTGTVLAPTNHTGGIVGKDATEKRRISPLWFLNAVRYHNGGIAGLKPDEVPTILQRGEQVIPKNEVGNGGTGGKAQDIKIINAVDSASVIEAGMRSASGQKTILNFFRANKNQIKSVLA